MTRFLTLAAAALLFAGSGVAFAQGPDRDGPRRERSISVQEAQERAADRFEKNDPNKDGRITKQEMLAEAERRIDSNLARVDANKDGAVSREEALTEVARTDANKDGKISRGERMDVMEERREQRKR
jgi:Ca2+-binding EF-hand superfamily protein